MPVSPLVSILIPAHNAELWIGETLESSLVQTWQNIEIIIVNDGSTDNTLAIANSFASKNVLILNQSKKGASAARNRALKEAQGDFIQYLDADDLLAPDKIERQIQVLTEHGSRFVASGAWARFELSLSDATFIPEAVWRDMSPIDWIICAWEGGGMISSMAWLLPRNIVNNAGPWNETISLNDDGEYFCRAVLASEGVKFCSEARSFYRSDMANSLSRSRSFEAYESALRCCELCSSYLIAKENGTRTRHACATTFKRFIYEVHPSMTSLIVRAQERAESFGGSTAKIGGLLYRMLHTVAGYRLAKRAQALSTSIRIG